MHARLAKGGYMFAYEIKRDGDTVGELTVLRASRNDPEVVTYSRNGSDMPTLQALMATVERDIAQAAGQ